MKNTISFLIMTMLIAISAASSQQSSSNNRIEDIISKMTLEEKIDFIGGFEDFNIRAVPRLGVPQTRMADGPVGVRNYGPATAFPATITLVASWDTALASRFGNAIGKEARAKNVHIMLCPAMNIHRAPMCGRNFEYLGEDPFLAGKIAAMYIKGMQQEGVMATAKHFMANNQEYDRNNVSSDMDERTMREIYLPAFHASVTEGHIAAIMTSYNLINGVHASQHDYLLNKILKDEWKFDGIVMSDWGSTYDGVASANAGLDLEMPSGKFMCRDMLIPAIKDGRVPEKTIDDKIRRILRQYERFGFLENPDNSKGYLLDSASVRKTAIDAARGGIVLLKNDGNILPLNTSKIKTIALIGPNADPAVTGGGGSSLIYPRNSVSFYEAMQQVAGNNLKIKCVSGIYEDDLMPDEFFNRTDFYTYVDGKKTAGMKGEFYSKRWPEGTPDYQQTFPKINQVFNDSMPGISRRRFAAQFSGHLKVDQGGIYHLVVSTQNGFRLMINDQLVLESWGSIRETAHSAMVKLEGGNENTVVLEYVQWDDHGVLRMGYEAPAVCEQQEALTLQKAVRLAVESDLTILCVGFNHEIEREGIDRSFSLPGEQEKLIHEIMKTGKDFIVVLNAGGNVDMNGWLSNAKALVHAWYPGGEGNIALAEILLGITNPSGKLPVSFEKRWEDNATYKSYYDEDGDKHVKYTEGVFLGYRHFDKDNIEPQFPFGFGLSYTTFEYSNIIVNKDRFSPSEPVEVQLTVKNTGKVDGAEVVQLYVGDPVSSLPRPVKELKAFAKIALKAGESKEVQFTLHADAFQYFNPEKLKWVIEPGDFTILAGSSSRDIRLKKTISVHE
ncbi:MAG: glycoside hydrolase family 3 C-terminal domain-containing protein [Bacteroidota bacterium]